MSTSKKASKPKAAKKESAHHTAEKKPSKPKVAKKNVAKKSAKAKAPKKAAAKKSPAKVRVKTPVKKAGDEYVFFVQDGTKVSDLKELALLLDAMEDHVFFHHVNPDKNDFANWVREVFEESDLADEIQSIMDKMHTQRLVLRYLVKKHL